MSNSIKAPLYSVAALFSAVGLGLSIPLIVFSFPAKAQTNQSFSQCVLTLYSGPYIASDAAKNCLTAFRGRSVNEDFTTCVNALYKGPFIQSDANQYCQQAFQNSASSTPANNGNPTIIVIPQGNVEQSQPTERRTQRQCIHKTFNQVWADIHCQFNNGMFEWRTVYLD